MADIVDSLSESGWGGDSIQVITGGATRVGQCFACSANKNLYSAKFYIKKQNLPTDSCRAILYDMTGTYGTSGKPTGSALATSSNYSVSTLSDSVYALIEFTFPSGQQPTLNSGTKYCIELNYDGGGGNGNIRDGVFATGGSEHSGNFFTYSGSYSADSTRDAIFYVYGTTPTVDYTLATSVGQFVLTGINSIFKIAKLLTTQVTNYTLTGVNISFNNGKALITQVGQFALTGINTIFNKTLHLMLSVGQFNLIGVNTGLSHIRTLITTAGQFTLTGVSALMSHLRTLITQAGQFAITGINISFSKSKHLITSVGRFILSGLPISFKGQGSWKWKNQLKHNASITNSPTKHQF